MKKRILVVDDDRNFGPALTKFLQTSGYEATSAYDGEDGYRRYASENFDLIISDIQMPKMNGIQLLKAIRESGKTPVILITGFAELVEAAEAFRLGASGFLPKPFKKEGLLELIGNCLAQTPAPSEEVEEFSRLNVEDFVSGRQLQFDIYFQIADKFIKVAHQGSDLPPERIEQYRKKGLRYLFMRKSDFSRYVGMNLNLLKAVRNNAKIGFDRRIQLAKHTGEIVAQKMIREKVGEENYAYAKTYVENTLGILTEQEEGLALLEALSRHTDFLYGHSVGVSMISVLIAKKMEWHSISNLFKVSMGGLLHDVGQKELEPELLQKLRLELSAEEIQLFESHSSRGLKILSQLKGVPSDVLDIVIQHHEDCMGLGFPHKRRRRSIHPMARLIAVADEFCYLTLKGPNSPELSGKDAVRQLQSTSSQRLDPDFLEGLGKVFCIEA